MGAINSENNNAVILGGGHTGLLAMCHTQEKHVWVPSIATRNNNAVVLGRGHSVQGGGPPVLGQIDPYWTICPGQTVQEHSVLR